MGDRRARNWVFTLNNPLVEDATFGVKGAKYLFWQVEKGATGTVHLQGVMVLRSGCTLTALKRRIPGAHLEEMSGTLDQAIHYSSKPHDGCVCKHCVAARLLPDDGVVAGPFSFGEKPAVQGKRTDIDNAMEMIRAGKREREIAETEPGVWLRYNRSLEKYRRLLTPNRTQPTKSLALWGPPGSGKSKRAFEEGSDSQFWVVRPKESRGAVWWDGYESQDVVVIDEFYGWMSRDLVQRLCDRYPLNVETKGGSVAFTSPRIIFTSNKHPKTWWKMGLGAMERRLSGDLGSIEYVGTSQYVTENSWLTSSAYASAHDANVVAGDYPAISANLRQ